VTPWMGVGVQWHPRHDEIMWPADLLHRDEIPVAQQGSISNTASILRGMKQTEASQNEASIYSF
jgi:hypothetical protein